MHLSRRTARNLQPNPLAGAVAAARAAGTTLVDLTCSNPTRARLDYDTAQIRRALASREALVYEPSAFGLPAARAAVARHARAHGQPTDPERLMLTASTSEAYGFLFKLLCDAGDEVLVPQPGYPLFDALAAHEDVTLVPYRLAYDGDWHLDGHSLDAARSDRTRAVIVVHPNNPTGSFLKTDELRAIEQLGLPIISDEVFGSYAHARDPRRIPSLLGATARPTFVLGGLSKLGLPQVKLGWMAWSGVHEEAIARLEYIADTYLSVSAQVQHGATRLLAASERTRAAIAARCQRNLAHVERIFCEGSAVSPWRVEGGWAATLRLPSVQTDEQWALELLAHGVLVHPGYLFDFHQDALVVVSLLTPEEDLCRGLSTLHRVVAAHASDAQVARRAR